VFDWGGKGYLLKEDVSRVEAQEMADNFKFPGGQAKITTMQDPSKEINFN
jgi:hypothetical protein